MPVVPNTQAKLWCHPSIGNACFAHEETSSISQQLSIPLPWHHGAHCGCVLGASVWFRGKAMDLLQHGPVLTVVSTESSG